ncbi:hypothetical protein CMI49_01975 [Candidatus Pacearchaeota archaeon]|nr:hypothetical protein [Candidatus Pacearchaeota archaeon]
MRLTTLCKGGWAFVCLHLLIKGMGNKTGPFDYLGHPVPLFLGESKKKRIPMYRGGTLGWTERVTIKLIENVGARQLKRSISLEFII